MPPARLAAALLLATAAAAVERLTEEYVTQNAGEMWRAHKREQGLNFAADEDGARYQSFVAAMMRAARLQRLSPHARFAPNALSHLTDAEFRRMRGLRAPPPAAVGAAAAAQAAADGAPEDAPAPDCEWGAAVPGYIKGCASGCQSFTTLALAQAVCASRTSCGGVTNTSAGFELRAGHAALDSPSGETSWLISNADACHPQVPLPAVDWRERGAVTSVKDQGLCGACWAFSATGNIEGQWAIAGGALTPLSEEELASCDTTNNGCDGGLMGDAFDWIVSSSNGTVSTECAYPYASAGRGAGEATPACDASLRLSAPGAAVTGRTAVMSTEDEIADFVATRGPLSIAVDATDFQSYAGGVLSCATNGQIDHGVLAVGLGNDAEAGPYYIVKNSWGAVWGESGYVRVAYGANSCLIATYAVSAVVDVAALPSSPPGPAAPCATLAPPTPAPPTPAPVPTPAPPVECVWDGGVKCGTDADCVTAGYTQCLVDCCA